MDIDYYIRVEKGRKKPGKHPLTDNIVLFSAFYTVLSNPKIIYGYLHGHVGGHTWDDSRHKVVFDAAGKMLHHFRAHGYDNYFFCDALTDEDCDIPLSDEDERTFTLLSDTADSWCHDVAANDVGGRSISPERFDEFVQHGKRSNAFTTKSLDMDFESIYCLCDHASHYHFALCSPEFVHNYVYGE